MTRPGWIESESSPAGEVERGGASVVHFVDVRAAVQQTDHGLQNNTKTTIALSCECT